MRITIIWKETKIKKFHHFFKKKKIFKALRREEIERPIFRTAETNNNFLGVLPGEFENLLLCS